MVTPPVPSPRQPPEWAPQQWLWIGFPHDAAEWPGMLDAAQEEIAAFANAVVQAGDRVKLVTRGCENTRRARNMVDDAVELCEFRYGDIWLRDTGPLVVSDAAGKLSARRFAFNGWGGKFEMAGDEDIGEELAADADLETSNADWILEGGAIDVDGTGLAVTTEQCLTHPNRNTGALKSDIERWLARDLGIERMLWLGKGLANDHTDGHVDNLARFVAPGLLALPAATGADDPNAHVYEDARRRAETFGLETVAIPSPGRMEEHGEALPASHMNFAITNRSVIVPTYGSPAQVAALETLARLFPTRQVVGLDARAVLSGGGGFHCASQQMPVGLF